MRPAILFEEPTLLVLEDHTKTNIIYLKRTPTLKEPLLLKKFRSYVSALIFMKIRYIQQEVLV